MGGNKGAVILLSRNLSYNQSTNLLIVDMKNEDMYIACAEIVRTCMTLSFLH